MVFLLKKKWNELRIIFYTYYS